MNVRAIVTAISLLIRLLRQINQLRAPKSRSKETRASRPARAGRALAGRRGEPSARVAAPARSGRWLGKTLRMLVAAGVAGTASYLVVRQGQRRAARRRPVHAPFPEELLEVLAPPGGEGRFFYTGEGLIDVDTDLFYPVVDGIPDFGGAEAVDARTAQLQRWYGDGGWMMEWYDPLIHGFVIPFALQGNPAGSAALAGAVAAEAHDGWCLSVPCGTGLYEIEMARANPHARFLCLDTSWGMVLEARRKALAAGLANLYFVRGDAQLLPLQTTVFDSVWSASGFETYPRLEQAVTQLMRVAKPGAIVAGVSPVPGGPRLPDLALRLSLPWSPGVRDLTTHLSLLSAAGLRELRAVRDGAMVRFLGTRAA